MSFEFWLGAGFGWFLAIWVGAIIKGRESVARGEGRVEAAERRAREIG